MNQPVPASAPALVGGNLVATLESRAAAEGWADRPLLRVADRTYSHGEVYDHSAHVAALLRAHGVELGDRVLIVAPDSVEFAAAFLGTLRIGAIAVTINPALTPQDHAALLEDAAPRVAVADDAIAERFESGPRPPKVIRTAVLLEEAQQLDPVPAVELADGAPAYVQYTSGTTGGPKGALHRHGDPLVYYDAVAAGVYGLTPDDVIFCVSKMFFAYGLPSSLLHPMIGGASAVLERGRPTPELVQAACARHGVTILLTVPSFYAALVDLGHPEAFAAMRLAVSGGEPLPTRVRDEAERLLGCPILNHLGSTEVGHGYAGDLPHDRKGGRSGRVLPPYEIEIRDADGVAVDAGVEGQVWVTGPTLLVEYVGKPEATAQAMRDGWLRSGDLGILDADGYLTLAGRADDVEIVSGYKVWPAEIEGVLSRHDAVAAIAVVGDVVDDRSLLRALVVPRPGTEPAQEIVDELVALGRDGLAPFKVPRLYSFVDELPRTPTGKLQRFRLRRELRELAGSAPTFRRRDDWAGGRSDSGNVRTQESRT